jgi:tRNA pseudouridine38-40 synthase
MTEEAAEGCARPRERDDAVTADGADRRHRAFRLAYDGRPFYGYQRQPDVPTVEGALFDAVEALGLADVKPPGYAAAGRTDAGVSALAQTVAFRCPSWCSPAALNSELPAAVRAWARADVADGFHATHDAARREYTYELYAPDARVDDGRIAAALAALAGEHDFHNLTPDSRNTVRTLSTGVVREGDFLVLRFAASGFVRHQVRRLVSLVRRVGDGAPLAAVDRALAPGELTGDEGIPAASPEPLVLTGVDYPGVSFAVDEAAARSARTLFDEQAVRARTRARVAGRVRDGL